MERAHFQFYIVVLDNGYSYFEKIELAVEQKVIPNSQAELGVCAEAIVENRQKPADQIHARFQLQTLKMVLDFRLVLLE